MAETKTVDKAAVEKQIASLEKQKESASSEDKVGIRRQLRSLRKSIGVYVPRAERTKKAETKKAVANAATKAKPAAKKTGTTKPATATRRTAPPES